MLKISSNNKEINFTSSLSSIYKKFSAYPRELFGALNGRPTR